MKVNFTRLATLALAIGVNYSAFCQLNWQTTGNVVAPGQFIGSTNNQPLQFRTNNLTRLRLNGTQTATLNGVVNHDVTGYFGIGPNGFFNANTPWSMLHLEGPDNTGFGGNGWRRWMNTGLYMRENSDGMYVGMMSIPGSINRSDAIISWSDDNNPSNNVDKLRFIFSGNNDGNGGGSTNPRFGGSLYGYEYMRMHPFLGTLNSAGTPIGHIGIGPLFTETYGPQSRVHMHAEDRLSNFTQYTNEWSTLTNGAGAGLRTGIVGHNTNNLINGIAVVYNQENRPLLLSANGNTTNINGFTTNERVRIMAYNTPTTLAAGYGTFDPGALIPHTNVTRMSVSHDPSIPLTRPLSLLHLGYNTTPALNGWRRWMDIGTFTTDGTDHVYVGLKNEGTDRKDAVVGWGDNQFATNGPDVLRFIFTSNGSGSTIANSSNGLETGRFFPGFDETFTYLLPAASDFYGRFGVGDFTASGVNENPTHKLDVVGNGRFRYLPDSLYLADSTVNKIVMVDSMGVLRWASLLGTFS